MAEIKSLSPNINKSAATIGTTFYKINGVIKPYPYYEYLWSLLGNYRDQSDIYNAAKAVTEGISALPDSADYQYIELMMKPRMKTFRDAVTVYQNWLDASKARIKAQRRIEESKLD